MTAPDIELLQFPYSPYNEKARWALDFKRVPHRRSNYLPGPHIRTIKKLTGQSQTPVLHMDGNYICGSARILDELERRFPAPALYPGDPAERMKALKIQNHIDIEVGPKVRLALFSVMIEEPGYMSRILTEGHSPAARLLYRASFPFAKGLIRKANGLTGQDVIDEAFLLTRRALDEVWAMVANDGHTVAGQFTVADLAVAAILAPLADPPHPAMSRPKPMPPRLQDFLSEWRVHPAIEWVIATYRAHRPPSAEVAL